MNTWYLSGVALMLLSLIWQVVASRLAGSLQRWVGAGAIALALLAAVSVGMGWEALIDVTLVGLALFTAMSAGRLVLRRLHPHQLRTLTIKTAWGLLLSLGGLVGARLVALDLGMIIAFLALGGAFGTLLLALVSSVRYRLDSAYNLKLRSLPTVSLALPARNETHALTETLNAATASTYPRLEVIVLDDCSQDATPAIIRDYAHAGIRFVRGHEPSAGWLGKNSAYRVLSEQASGELLLFCGVDVHLAPQSVGLLVQIMYARQADMVSVLPLRPRFDWPTALIQPLRYFWLLALPRRSPPVLSSCWLIRREALDRLGGFSGLGNAIIPERLLARTLNQQGRYQFVMGDRRLGVTTRKRLSSQCATAVRTIYPSLHRSLVATYWAVVASTALFILPWVALLTDHSGLVWVWLGAALFASLAQLVLVTSFNPPAWWLTIPLWPLSMSVAVTLLAWSAWQYEFGEVNWKGRNICLPVMRPSVPRVS